MNSEALQKVLIIVGPTGVGKTKLSLAIANIVNGEIISADSRLLYRGMDIGTAKPSVEGLSTVSHYLINVSDPDETWSLARFNKAVQEAIKIILKKGKLPILVGGTGQYIRSLVEGWEIPEIKPNEDLRRALDNWGKRIGFLELHRKMSLLDSESGKSIQPQNVRRTIRALEVIFSTGKRFSELRRKTEPIHDYKIIGLTRPREELYAMVDARIVNMFENGLIEEVEVLVKKGYTKDLPSMSGIGYCEVMKHLAGEITLEEVKMLMKRKTRQFIRRQANWFKQDNPLIEWYGLPPDPEMEVISSVTEWLKGE